MKFSGLHFHMILLVAIICVVIYVFYVSKDILTLDNEVRNLKTKIELLQKQLTDVNKCKIQQPQSSIQVNAATRTDSKHQQTLCKKQTFNQETAQETAQEEKYVNDETDSVDSEQVQHMLNNIIESEESDKAEVPEDTQTDSTKDYSIQELKDLCKKHSLDNKGTKKKLIETLKTNGITLS